MMNIYTARKLIMVFADADFLIGLFYVDDAHHKTCLNIRQKTINGLITSWDVIDEVVTKLTYFGKKNIAFNFIKMVLKDDIIVVYPSIELANKTKEIFGKQTLKHVSLTDCMNMAIAKEKKVEYFLSFDAIYEKNGFKLVK